MKKHFIFALFALAFINGFAQDHPGTLQVRHIGQAITLDGALEEAVWEKADNITDFWQYSPSTTVFLPFHTI